MKSGVSLLCAVVLVLVGCGKPAASKSVKTKIDVCDLITDQEVQAIQGSPVKNRKNSERSFGGFRNSQCIYMTEDAGKSVVVNVTQIDQTNPTKRTPKKFWEQKFGRFSGRQVEQEDQGEPRDEEMEKKSVPPVKIDGLGDEAYWVRSMGAALYVLKGDLFVRIGVGGSDTEDVRIHKSKALAEKALKHL